MTDTGQFPSILFAAGFPADLDRAQAPDCFPDLNLDQVVEAVARSRPEHALAPFLCRPLTSTEEVEYRQAVARDLDGTSLTESARRFGDLLRSMRQDLRHRDKVHHHYQKAWWTLHAACLYVRAVRALDDGLTTTGPESAGWRQLRTALAAYVRSDAFVALAAAVDSVIGQLEDVQYTTTIFGPRITVSRYEEAADYSAAVERTFARFRQGDGATKDYRTKPIVYDDMNHIEAGVLELVAARFPETFAALEHFARDRAQFAAAAVLRLDREVQFLLAWFDYLAPIRTAGLAVDYPRVSARSKELHATATYDLALAAQLCAAGKPVVTNDIELSDPERIVVVSGPNQGGKTTLARTVGQLHHLARLGLPLPGNDLRLHLVDAVLTHFERQENLDTLSGKLQDDLLRIHRIVTTATGDSLIVMNELFTSTTLPDAVFLGTEIVHRIIDLDALCVYVTFVDELSRLGPTTVSMVSTIAPDRPDRRTFKLVRRPADGRAYALALAQRYGLTYAALTARIAS